MKESRDIFLLCLDLYLLEIEVPFHNGGATQTELRFKTGSKNRDSVAYETGYPLECMQSDSVPLSTDTVYYFFTYRWELLYIERDVKLHSVHQRGLQPTYIGKESLSFRGRCSRVPWKSDMKAFSGATRQ